MRRVTWPTSLRRPSDALPHSMRKPTGSIASCGTEKEWISTPPTRKELPASNFIHAIGGEQGASHGGTSFNEDLAHPQCEQLGQGTVRIVRPHLMERRLGVSDMRLLGNFAHSPGHSHRLTRSEHRGIAHGETRIISENRPRSHHHRLRAGTQRVHVVACLVAGQRHFLPLRSCDTSVDRYRHLQAHERPPARRSDQPFAINGSRLRGQHPADHLAACGREHSGATASIGGIVDCVDDSCDSGIDKSGSARPDAPDVPARFEGDDGGGPARTFPSLFERDDFRVRSPRASVETTPDDITLLIDDHTSHARIPPTWCLRVAGEGERLAHRLTPCHRAAASARVRNACTVEAGSLER